MTIKMKNFIPLNSHQVGIKVKKEITIKKLESIK